MPRDEVKEITYPFLSYLSVKIWKLIVNFIPQFTRHVTTYPWWDENQSMLVKSPQQTCLNPFGRATGKIGGLGPGYRWQWPGHSWTYQCQCYWLCNMSSPDNKVNWVNMGHISGRQDPGGPHVGPMNFAIWEVFVFHEGSQLPVPSQWWVMVKNP